MLFQTPAAQSAQPTEVGDRSTTFQPVEGGTEHRSGETLLVGAYAGIWTLLMLWLVVQWMKQTTLAKRMTELEAAVAKAAKSKAAS